MTTATSSCCRLEWYGRSHGSRFLDGDHCGGALAPLRWEDLDIETETGSVNKQTMKKMRTTTPGNGPSTRTLPGSPPSRIGSMYCPDSVAALHQRILRGPRLEHIRPHDLRHTVTLALQKHSGAPDGKLSFPAGALQFFRGMSRDVRLPFKVRNPRICTTVNAAMASYLFQAEAQNQ